MTVREIKIAAFSATLAAFLGVGASKTVAGAAPAVTDNDTATLRIFHAAKPTDGGSAQALAFEVCARAIVPGNDAGTEEVTTEQGCESALVPAGMQAKVDALMTAALQFWETKRGTKP